MRVHAHRSELGKPEATAVPWTIHTSARCIPAKQIYMEAPCTTQYHPDKSSNPRLFLTCNAKLLPLGNDKYAIVS